MERIIALSGRARSGKDTCAECIKEEFERSGKKVLMVHYADLLKFICKTFLGWDGQKDEKGRHILQYVGTDIVRKQRPDYWVDFIIDVLGLFGDQWDIVVIPDARFPNEIDRLKQDVFAVTHVKVVRPNFESELTSEQKQHKSETAMENYPSDCLIKNEGSLRALRDLCTSFARQFI